jgi:hypothetical protein
MIEDIKIWELEGFEQVEAVVAGRHLDHFGRVYSFQYFGRRENQFGDRWRDIELIMEEWGPPYAQIGFRFRGIADVSFTGFGDITGLFFQSIADRGWEKLRYEVGDFEQGEIHLFCEEISVFAPDSSR